MIGVSYIRIASAVALVIAVSAGAWKIHHSGYTDGKAEAQAEWNADKLAVSEQNARNLQAVALNSNRLQAEADTQRKSLNAHISSIDLERDELLKRLQSRPSRPDPSTNSLSTNPGVGADIPSCTGAELYKQDGEFLGREASRAEVLRARLKALESQYEAVQKLMNK